MFVFPPSFVTFNSLFFSNQMVEIFFFGGMKRMNRNVANKIPILFGLLLLLFSSFNCILCPLNGNSFGGGHDNCNPSLPRPLPQPPKGGKTLCPDGFKCNLVFILLLQLNSDLTTGPIGGWRERKKIQTLINHKRVDTQCFLYFFKKGEK